jgi:predicted GIY-YIG superfamily endonuclease
MTHQRKDAAMNLAELFEKHPEFCSLTTQVYIIQLETPIIRSNGVEVWFYCGSTSRLKDRLKEHRKGKAYNGSPLLDLANQREIDWKVVRSWFASREFEKYIKSRKRIRDFVETEA